MENGKNVKQLIQDITELIDRRIGPFPTSQPEQMRLCTDEGPEFATDKKCR